MEFDCVLSALALGSHDLSLDFGKNWAGIVE